MSRSNSVYGPARRPIFDPAAVFGNRTIVRPGVPILEIAWSWGGNVHPEDLADPSPAWRAIDYEMLGGTRVDVLLIQVTALWTEASELSETTTISLHGDSDGVIDTITLTGSDVENTHNLDWIVDGEDRMWLTATSTGDTGDSIGLSLSYIARYQYVEHAE